MDYSKVAIGVIVAGAILCATVIVAVKYPCLKKAPKA
jgi:hypothetical protein